MKNTVNLRSFDVLRGLLAVFVLCHHTRWLLWVGFENWSRLPHPVWQRALAYATVPLRYGHEAVMIFFVLSGFFIHLRVAERLAAGQKPSMDVRTFFERRLHRLLPPYVLALAVTVGLDAWGRQVYPDLYVAATGDAFVDANFSRMRYSARAVVPALVMLPDSLGWQFGSNGPLWSLAYEVVYYALYPGWLLLRRGGWWMSYGVGGLGIAAAAVPFAAHGFLPLVLSHYPIWLAGAALAELVHGRLPVLGFQRALLPVVAVLCLGLASPRVPLPIVIAAYTLGGAATVLCFLSLPVSIVSHFLHRAWEKIGSASYTVYIVHFSALALLCAAMMRLGGGRPTSGWPALGGAGVTAVFCGGCYWLCERHFLHRRLSVRSVQPPAAAPAGPAREQGAVT